MEYINKNLFSLPTLEQISRWQGQPSFATKIENIAKWKNAPSVNLSRNTINKYFGKTNETENSKHKKYVEEINKFKDRVFPALHAMDETTKIQSKNIKHSHSATIISSMLMSEMFETDTEKLVLPPKPKWSFAATLYEMLLEEISYGNTTNFENFTTNHYERLLSKNKHIGNSKNQNFLAINTYLYLMACNHANFGAFMDFAKFPNPNKLLLELYRPPYSKGIFQERYFSYLRELTKDGNWSSLKLRKETKQMLREGESSNRRQINAWKNPNENSNLTFTSLQKILENSSLRDERILEDDTVYWSCYQSMLTIRNMVEEIYTMEDAGQVDDILNQYCNYFEYFTDEIGPNVRSQNTSIK